MVGIQRARDLHLTIGRLAAIKHCVAVDLIRKRRYTAQEERYPSLVGSNWGFFPPKQVKRARVIKRKVKLKMDSEAGEPSEERVSQCMEVEQPGSPMNRPECCKRLRYQGETEFNVEEIRADKWRKEQPGSSTASGEPERSHGVDELQTQLKSVEDEAEKYRRLLQDWHTWGEAKAQELKGMKQLYDECQKSLQNQGELQIQLKNTKEVAERYERFLKNWHDWGC